MSIDGNLIAIGQRIREVRGQLTQAEFATRLDVDRKTVTRWEAGERMPDGGSLLALLNEFDVDIQEILTGTRRSNQARNTQSSDIDWQLLEQIISGVEAFLSERKAKLRPDKKAGLIRVLYAKFSEDKHLNQARFKDFMEAVMATV